MLDDFFVRALVAGAGVALIAGPLGCFIVWRRLAYFGDTLSHAALFGIALAFLLEVNVTLAVISTSLLVALALMGLRRREGAVSSDALLGLMSHGSLALNSAEPDAFSPENIQIFKAMAAILSRRPSGTGTRPTLGSMVVNG